jgi:serine phosphatase RsbU (regulator of sigma subunit)
LGLIELPHFVETIVELGRDDAFVLYTDGLFGGAEGKRRRLTPEMLAKTVDHAAPTAEALLMGMLNQVAPSDGKTRLPDDMAVVVVRHTA